MTVYTASNVRVDKGMFILTSPKTSVCFRIAQISSLRKEIYSTNNTWELTVWLICGKRHRFEFLLFDDGSDIYQQILQAMSP
jgi:hypothetical protein